MTRSRRPLASLWTRAIVVAVSTAVVAFLAVLWITLGPVVSRWERRVGVAVHHTYIARLDHVAAVTGTLSRRTVEEALVPYLQDDHIVVVWDAERRPLFWAYRNRAQTILPPSLPAEARRPQLEELQTVVSGVRFNGRTVPHHESPWDGLRAVDLITPVQSGVGGRSGPIVGYVAAGVLDYGATSAVAQVIGAVVAAMAVALAVTTTLFTTLLVRTAALVRADLSGVLQELTTLVTTGPIAEAPLTASSGSTDRSIAVGPPVDAGARPGAEHPVATHPVATYPAAEQPVATHPVDADARPSASPPCTPTLRIKEFVTLSEGVRETAAELAREREVRVRWAQDIAHDFRTPISALKAQIEGMIDGILERDDTRLHRLAKSVRGLEELTEAFLLLTKVEAPDYRVTPRSIDLSTFVAERVEQFADLCRRTHRPLSASVHPSAPAAFRGDRALIVRAVGNLIDNAVTHGMEGPVTLTVGWTHPPEQTPDRRSDQRWEDDGVQRLSFEVTNRGTMDTERVPDPFDRFSRSEETGNHGVGLAVVAAVARLHDGETWYTTDRDGPHVTVGFSVSPAKFDR